MSAVRSKASSAPGAWAGHLVTTTCVGALPRLQPFAPSTLVESVLPDEDGRIGFRVVPAQEAEVLAPFVAPIMACMLERGPSVEPLRACQAGAWARLCGVEARATMHARGHVQASSERACRGRGAPHPCPQFHACVSAVFSAA